jgi:tRNA threonylcarbamoyladenosine biosynthesis protein TsaE
MAKATDKHHITLTSLADTLHLGAKLGRCCVDYFAQPNDGVLITLDGPMGAGKTTVTQAFGKAIGITETMASPTFVLIHTYHQDDGLTLNHADCYRLEHQADTIADDLLEITTINAITLVEWASLSPTITQSADLAITLVLNTVISQRAATLTAHSEAGHALLKQLKQLLEGQS